LSTRSNLSFAVSSHNSPNSMPGNKKRDRSCSKAMVVIMVCVAGGEQCFTDRAQITLSLIMTSEQLWTGLELLIRVCRWFFALSYVQYAVEQWKSPFTRPRCSPERCRSMQSCVQHHSVIRKLARFYVLILSSHCFRPSNLTPFHSDFLAISFLLFPPPLSSASPTSLLPLVFPFLISF
jgi:hypothetical protein